MVNGISALVGSVTPAGQTESAGSAEPTQTEAFGVAMLLAMLSSQPPAATVTTASPILENGLTAEPQPGQGESPTPQGKGSTPAQQNAPSVTGLSHANTPLQPVHTAQADVVPLLATAAKPVGGSRNDASGGVPSAPNQREPQPHGVLRPAPLAVTPQRVRAPVGSATVAMLQNHTVAARSSGAAPKPAVPTAAVPTAAVPQQHDAPHPPVAVSSAGPSFAQPPTLGPSVAPVGADRVNRNPPNLSAAIGPELDSVVEALEVKSVLADHSAPLGRQQLTRARPAPAATEQPPVLEQRGGPAGESLKSLAAMVARPIPEVVPAEVSSAGVAADAIGAALRSAQAAPFGSTVPVPRQSTASQSGNTPSHVTRTGLPDPRARNIAHPIGGASLPQKAPSERNQQRVVGHSAERESGGDTARTLGHAVNSRIAGSDGQHNPMVAPLGAATERTVGAQQATPSFRAVQSQQTVRPEQPVVRPNLTDRVTVKFTDAEGVEGRLRVAVRGQTVRATIVSEDPAVARRLGAQIGELQQTLDQQGFHDSQIAIQHARRGAEVGAIALGTTARTSTDVSAAASRGPEEHGNRERTQQDHREQQGSSNGRSQQRSRQRDER